MFGVASLPASHLAFSSNASQIGLDIESAIFPPAHPIAFSVAEREQIITLRWLDPSKPPVVDGLIESK